MWVRTLTINWNVEIKLLKKMEIFLKYIYKAFDFYTSGTGNIIQNYIHSYIYSIRNVKCIFTPQIPIIDG